MAKEKTVEGIKSKRMSDKDKPLFIWKSPDNIQYKRSYRWYVILLIAAIVLGGLLYWQQIWTGVALVGVATVLFFIMSQIKPKEITMAIYSEGIVVDDKAYKFDQFKSFWINQSQLPKAKLQRIGLMAGQVDLPLQNVDPEQIRLFLSKRLPEEADKGEDLVDTINRIMRF